MAAAQAARDDPDTTLLAALRLSQHEAAGSCDGTAAAGTRAAPAVAAMAVPEDSGSTSADEMTCSICLQHTELEEIASISPGCGHSYCVKCILRWAAHRERSTCPQCKAPFDYLLTYYRLDGSLNDFPCEESVTLLKRARFFTDHMQEVEQGRCKLSAEDSSSEWRDYEPFFQEYDDDEAVEDYYFSAAAGRARIVLGNRRFGENGFVSSGRSYARPAQTPPAQRKKKGGQGTATAPKPEAPSSAGSGRRRRNRGPSAAGRASDPGPGANSGTSLAATAAASPAAVAASPADGPAAAPGSRPAGSLPPPRPRTQSASQPIPLRGGSTRGAPAVSPFCEDSDGDGVDVAGLSPSGSSPPLGCSPGSGTPGTGRRARRNNRRAVEDAIAVVQH